MGNSYCYNFYYKPELLITKAELNVDCKTIIHENDTNNNNIYPNIVNAKNDYVNKSTMAISPPSAKHHHIINPLPDIVTVKRKKQNN